MYELYELDRSATTAPHWNVGIWYDKFYLIFLIFLFKFNIENILPINIFGPTEPMFLQKNFFSRNIEIFIYRVLPAESAVSGSTG